jgi:hypothetical protein
MRSPCCLCVPLPSAFEWTNIYVNLYVYRVTWARSNGILYKFLPSVCVCIPLSIIARQQLKKRVPAASKYCWMRQFLCGPCRIKGKWSISSYRTSCCYNVVTLSFHYYMCCFLAIFDALFISDFPPTCVLRVLHVSCTFILSHRAQCCGTTESHCVFHSIWIALVSKIQLSRAVRYSRLYLPPKATERI